MKQLYFIFFKEQEPNLKCWHCSSDRNEFEINKHKYKQSILFWKNERKIKRQKLVSEIKKYKIITLIRFDKLVIYEWKDNTIIKYVNELR